MSESLKIEKSQDIVQDIIQGKDIVEDKSQDIDKVQDIIVLDKVQEQDNIQNIQEQDTYTFNNKRARKGGWRSCGWNSSFFYSME